MEIHLIAAVAANNVIGRNGTLPWHIPSDLKHFRRLTTGHTVVMGRRTYESIGRPLPNRRNIIVSSTMTAPAGVEIARSLEAAFTAASQSRCFVIGGARLYADALPYSKFLHLTRIDAEVEGDVFFPSVDWSAWMTQEEVRSVDETAGLVFAFCTYQRKETPQAPRLTPL